MELEVENEGEADSGENDLEACKRELQEEIGLNVIIFQSRLISSACTLDNSLAIFTIYRKEEVKFL